MSEIESVLAREILDARGSPTLEVEVQLAGGFSGRAAVPTGARHGRAGGLVDRRDADPGRFAGRGMLSAVRAVETELGPAINGIDALDQAGVDAVLLSADGTRDLARTGTAAVLGLSMAVARAAADSVELPLWRYLGGAAARVLPTPLVAVGGGIAAGAAARPWRALLVVPHGMDTFADALRAAVEVADGLADLASGRGAAGADDDALEEVLRAIDAAGYGPDEVGIAIDAAGMPYDPASRRYGAAGADRSSDELVALWQGLCGRFPVVALHDGCAAEDADGWGRLAGALGPGVQLVDGAVLHRARGGAPLDLAAGAADAALLDPSGVGTVTSMLDAVRLAHEVGVRIVVQSSEGETDDAFIADLAVATNAGQIRAGAPSQPGAAAKYNQLTRIAWALGEGQVYAGRAPLGRARR